MFCNSSFFQKTYSINSIPIIIKNDEDKNIILGLHPNDSPNLNHIYSKVYHEIISDSFDIEFRKPKLRICVIRN